MRHFILAGEDSHQRCTPSLRICRLERRASNPPPLLKYVFGVSRREVGGVMGDDCLRRG